MPVIKSFTKISPMIYAYNTPGVTYHDGWTKIGYTEKQTVKERIEQQTHTAGIQYKISWMDNALYKDGTGDRFTDHEFHSYLETNKKVEREKGTEWFKTSGQESKQYFDSFAMRLDDEDVNHSNYVLRSEQVRAVQETKDYFETGGKEFLWNAKPRFGKTLTSYDLIRQMNFKNVLIVTNRPSIANSWVDDFNEFISWQTDYIFIAQTDSIANKPGVVSRDEYTKMMIDAATKGKELGMIAFVSLQDLKGSAFFGGKFDKLQWINTINFDLMIVDESQEGVSTAKTERAFDNIHRDHTLYLSGTPFKQLASDQFTKQQIFNWSYADEQEAKKNWNSDSTNPYEVLPTLSMFTYQLSNMIYEKMLKASDMTKDSEAVDFAFDLNEFFATNEAGRFIHEEEIKKFLKTLSTNEKYPFSTPELRKEMSHTLWLLNRIASARALAKLLQNDPVFSEYEIVLAAGDGKIDDVDAIEKSFDKVKKAIAENNKTITLSVGQLTVGVTIPEWSGVLMLCNLQSASSYMQAAFRAQNPYAYDENGTYYRKENAYLYDFDPARTLIIFDEYANNLTADTAGGRGTTEDRKNNITRLLNFFPVIGEDDEGKMVELDAQQVLSIPRKIKSQDVVRKGFMSNFLFANISNIFGAPNVVTNILKKIAPAHEEGTKKDDKTDAASKISLDNNGEVEVSEEFVVGKSKKIFGEKIYEKLENKVDKNLPSVSDSINTSSQTKQVDKLVEDITKSISNTIKEQVVLPAFDEYDPKKSVKNRIEKEVETEVNNKMSKIGEDYKQTINIAQVEHNRRINEAETQAEIKQADEELSKKMNEAISAFQTGIQDITKEIIQSKPEEIVLKLEKSKKEEEKKSVEDSIRDHLRGFSRTIPSFVMAYGDENLTLANFDDYTEDDVFREVTSITEEEFRFLRDGGDIVNPKTGETEHFDGHLFDETVFNDSIKEFLRIKKKLANYFDESQEEDIIDYIPPQKTNQIYTPRWVVKMMIDKLENENPGCFDDPDKTFADLYMKSGLYITEIVKKLYNSEAIKTAYPDDKERLRHIFTKQVYGMAPTRIIYLIATNYILGFDENLKLETSNFVEADAAEASKKGKLDKLVNKYFKS